MKSLNKIVLILALLLIGQRSAFAETCAEGLGIAFTPAQRVSLCEAFGSSINQSLIPSADNTYDLGSSSKTFATGYFGQRAYFGTTVKSNIQGSTDGRLSLNGGNSATAHITAALGHASANFFVQNEGGSNMWTFSTAGNITQNASSGGDIVLSKAQTNIYLPSTNNITAAGTTVADATQLTAVFNNVTTVAASTGVKAWNHSPALIWIRNGGANTLTVYGNDASATINGGAAGAGVTVVVGAMVGMLKIATNTWIAFEAPAA